MERRLAEPTFLDALASALGGPKTKAFLDRCQALIDWPALVAAVGDLYGPMAKGGRPSS
jgi:hypothetical protein